MPHRLQELAGSPGFQLAVDEACLEANDAGDMGELVRVWQFDRPTVVLGRGSKAAVEVDRAFCEANGIPILRRCSGGATVVSGPGCLMYSVVLDLRERPALRQLDQTHQFVMDSLCGALRREVPDVEYQGICDLTLGNRKFSGNSLRVARDSVLYHGTLLYDADLDFIARCLKMPPRHPEYRQGRSHEAFLTNIPLSRDGLAAAVWEAFASELPAVVPPGERAASLCATRYDNPEWNFRH